VRLAKEKERRKPEEKYFLPFLDRLPRDRSEHRLITIGVYVPAQRVKGIFSFEIAAK